MNRTAVITGASSFVGYHLALAFAGAGWSVVATHSSPLDAYEPLRAERLAAVGKVARLVGLDVTDGAAVLALVAAERPALWVQHAGHATDYAAPGYDLMGSLAVNVAPLDAVFAALAGTGAGIIVTGSSMEYGASDAANREDEACWPDTPYGLSKLAETLRARQLSQRFGVSARVARVYIPYGRLDNQRKLLALVVDALRQGRPIDLSPCLQKRDFLGVGDLAVGYLALADDLARGGFDVFNLCHGAATPLRDLLLAVAERLGANPALLNFGAIPMRPGEPEISYGDNAKARALLGWTPSQLAQALDRDLLA